MAKDKIIIHDVTKEEVQDFFSESLDIVAKRAAEEAINKVLPMLSYDKLVKEQSDIMWYSWWGSMYFRSGKIIPTWKWFATLGSIAGIAALVVVLIN